jgi:phosphoribosylformylglycinamidine synthase
MTTVALRPSKAKVGAAEPLATLEQARSFGLSDKEWARIGEILGRTPTLTEAGVFSALWSEHCSYKSSKIYLRKFPTKGPRVAQGPGENAGAIDLGGGLVAVFKIESHNHPSFIEPVQGAATGVGGILRDIFTMGARPIALMNSLRFGHASHAKTPHLLAGVVKGVGGYGNSVGVPTVAGDVMFDPSYDGNILVNAFALGVCREDELVRAIAKGAGNLIMYLGAKTGRDGIHGATMASAAFDEGSEEKRPTVQVGDPFKEKLLIEACLELFRVKCLIGIQDMGAAGLSSSSAEMAARGSSGMRLDIDRIPKREPGMTAYETMLSESQERMLLCVEPKHQATVERIARKWGIDSAVVGEVTDTGLLEIVFAGEVAAAMPVQALTDEAPVYERPVSASAKAVVLSGVEEGADVHGDLLRLLGSANLCSRRWVTEQYDQDVGVATVRRPYAADAAVVRLRTLYPERSDALAMTVDVQSRKVAADPREGAKAAAMEAYRNLSATGAEPLAISDCLNFGNPEDPQVMGQFAEACAGLSEAALALGTPVISGNVSLYNQTEGRSIDPTPTVAMVGHIADVARSGRIAPPLAGEDVWIFGEGETRLDLSEYLWVMHGEKRGAPPPVDLVREKAACDAVAQLWRDGVLSAAHDASEGGMLVALAECVMLGEVGMRVKLQGLRFAEGGSWFVLVAPAAQRGMLEKMGAQRVGETTAEPALDIGAARWTASEMREPWEKALPAIAAGASRG